LLLIEEAQENFNEEMESDVQDEETNSKVVNWAKMVNWSKTVNWAKMTILGKILWNYKKYHMPYTFKSIESLRQYIELSAESWEDYNAAYEVAVLREQYSDFDFQPFHGTENLFTEHSYFTRSELELLLNGSEGHKYFYGTELLVPGDTINSIYYVESGSLRLYSMQGPENRLTIATIRSRQFPILAGLLSCNRKITSGYGLSVTKDSGSDIVVRQASGLSNGCS